VANDDPADGWHEQYLAGHIYAVDMAIVGAWRSKNPIPQWAHEELARRSWQKLKEIRETLRKQRPAYATVHVEMWEELEFKPHPGGRGKSISDELDKFYLVGAVEGARKLARVKTLKQAYEIAQQVLLAHKIPYELSSIAQLYPKWRKRYQPIPENMIFWESDAEEAEAFFHLYLFRLLTPPLRFNLFQ